MKNLEIGVAELARLAVIIFLLWKPLVALHGRFVPSHVPLPVVQSEPLRFGQPGHVSGSYTVELLKPIGAPPESDH